MLTLTRNFHPNSDVDRLYMQKSFGGRGLRQVQSSCESRIAYWNASMKKKQMTY